MLSSPEPFEYLTAVMFLFCLEFVNTASASAMTSSVAYFANRYFTTWHYMDNFLSFFGSSFSLAQTWCAEAALTGYFVKCWNSHMAAPLWNLFQSHTVFTLYRNDRIDISSGGLITIEFICTSTPLTHYAIFPDIWPLYLWYCLTGR